MGGEDEGLILSDALSSGKDLEEDCIERFDRETMQEAIREDVAALPDEQRALIENLFRKGLVLS